MNLYPFQELGVTQLVTRQSVLLGDDMGLGKTVQVARALKRLLDDRAVNRALIICPASLIYNWRYEINRWADGLQSVLYGGSERNGLLEGKARVIIGSYETISNDLVRPTVCGEKFYDIGIDLLIIDEAQRIKGADSVRSQVLSRLIAGRRWAITGTPLENHPRDLASILRFLFPNEFSEQTQRNDLARVLAYRDRCLVRRTKAEVGIQLPSKTVAYVPTKMTPDQEAEYVQECQSLRDSLRNSTSRADATGTLLGGLQRLRRIATISDNGESGKIDFIIDELDELLESNEKVVIFSSFAHLALPLVAKRLTHFGALLFTGDMSLEEREINHRRFLDDPTARVMCASVKAAGVGLTWTIAQLVYHMDLWWNPQVLRQADDRVHRIGQTEHVLVKRLISEATIEEGIRELLERKQDIFDFVIDDAPSNPTHRDSLEALLSLIDLRLGDVGAGCRAIAS